MTTGYWGQCLDIKDGKKYKNGENFIIRSFIICTP
jgi:hypothetical protein